MSCTYDSGVLFVFKFDSVLGTSRNKISKPRTKTKNPSCTTYNQNVLARGEVIFAKKKSDYLLTNNHVYFTVENAICNNNAHIDKKNEI